MVDRAYQVQQDPELEVVVAVVEQRQLVKMVNLMVGVMEALVLQLQ